MILLILPIIFFLFRVSASISLNPAHNNASSKTITMSSPVKFSLFQVPAFFSLNHAHKNASSEHVPSGNQLEDDLTPDDAASPNFYSPSSSDYSGFFDHFPDLSHFPEFGEIFRLSRTTTQRPPFRFPGYVRDVFPDDDYKVIHSTKPNVAYFFISQAYYKKRLFSKYPANWGVVIEYVDIN